jgi:hypothetical protein
VKDVSAADLDAVRGLVAADHGLVVLATTRPDHSVHASVVNAGVLDDPVTGQPVVGMVIRGNAKKLDYLRTNQSATVVFRAGWQWASVEGTVAIIGPDDPLEGFTGERLPGLLRDIFTAAGGTHDDWATYDRVMVQERRAAVLVATSRITSN